jgi:hypothetical protein
MSIPFGEGIVRQAVGAIKVILLCRPDEYSSKRDLKGYCSGIEAACNGALY